MTEEKSNLEREDEDIDELLDGDESEDLNETGDDSKDAPTLSDDALAEYNKRVGKNYKSWDDVAKREKEADKAFAKGEHKKESEKREEKPVRYDDEVVEELLLTKHPEAEHVLDDLREEAKRQGKSVLKLFRDSKYYQGEAKAIAEAKKVEDGAKSKIGLPSSGTGGGEFSMKDIDLDNPDHVKWLNAKPERVEKFNNWMAQKSFNK